MFEDEEPDILYHIAAELRNGLPDLLIAKEGQFTVLRNFETIAKIFKRDPKHLMKFLSSRLGTKLTMKGDQLYISKHIQFGDMGIILEDYISLFITCSNCGKPDTVLTKSNKVTFLQCLACGHQVRI